MTIRNRDRDYRIFVRRGAVAAIFLLLLAACDQAYSPQPTANSRKPSSTQGSPVENGEKQVIKNKARETSVPGKTDPSTETGVVDDETASIVEPSKPAADSDAMSSGSGGKTDTATAEPRAASIDRPRSPGQTTLAADRIVEITLPRAFPWPPPRPSARLILNQKLIEAAIAPDFTLGRVADKLQESLEGAGYEGSGYLAAPNGFVIVTRVEQTDAQGTPIDSHRWVGDIAASGFSLSSVVRLLASAPAGYFRVIVFAITDRPVAGGSDTGNKLELLRQWSQMSHLRLPASVRSVPYNDTYAVIALVYEFEKSENGDDPTAKVPGRHPAGRHLDGLKVKANNSVHALTGRID